jgi:hypothetical protein
MDDFNFGSGFELHEKEEDIRYRSENTHTRIYKSCLYSVYTSVSHVPTNFKLLF